MSRDYYLIKEAAAKVGVETHVLRYWEEELKMEIHRNKMGHRYYTEKDIEILSKVKELKERGLQLKAIREYLEKRRQQIAETSSDYKTDAIHFVAQTKLELGESVHEKRKENSENAIAIEEERGEMIPIKQHTLSSDEEKMEQFQQIMNKVLSNAIRENNELIGRSVGEHAANTVMTQIQGMTKEQEARAEERFRMLDQTLREVQKARAEAAASSMRAVDKRKQKRMKRRVNRVDSSVEVVDDEKKAVSMAE